MNPIEVELSNIDEIVIEQDPVNDVQKLEVLEGFNEPLTQEEVIEDIIVEVEPFNMEGKIDEELKRLENIHKAIIEILSTEDEYRSGKTR